MTDSFPTTSGLDALKSPCSSCESSACCWYVPLEYVEVNSYDNLDRLVLASCFESLEVGVHSDGRYVIYYAAPCRYFEADEKLSCSVYGTGIMPQACRNIRARGCWFQANVTNPRGDMIRLSETSLRQIAELYKFNTDRLVVSKPSWSRIKRELASSTCEETLQTYPKDNTQSNFQFPWEESREGKAQKDESDLSWDEALGNPCTGCMAYCCTSFEVTTGTPQTWIDFDRYRYLLQFPNTEVLIRDNGPWVLSLRSRCSHLTKDNQCGLMDQVTRPRFCVDYNAHSCHFRGRYSDPLQFRVGYDDFMEISPIFEFNLDGKAVHVPKMMEACERVLFMRENAQDASSGGT